MSEAERNDLFYVCSLIEYTARKTTNRRRVVAEALGEEGIKKQLLDAGVNHCLSFEQVSDKLIEQYHYPCLSIDLLKMGLIRSGNTALTPEDDRELERYLWPIVREMIKTAIENGQNLVVEGGYIPPHWEKELDDSYLREICYYCLVMSRRYILGHVLSVVYPFSEFGSVA